MSDSDLATAVSGRYWLVVVGYVLVGVAGTVGLAYTAYRGTGYVSLTLAATALFTVLAVLSLAVPPAMVLDSRELKGRGRSYPRYWRYVGAAVGVPLVTFLVCSVIVSPPIAAVIASGVLVVTTSLAGALYLYERYRAVGFGGPPRSQQPATQ